MKALLLWLLLILAGSPLRVYGQLTERRVENLEYRVSKLEDKVRLFAGAAFVGAVMAALWAQNSGRNAWLWFFATILLLPISLLILLYKNAGDVRARKKND